jgi:nitronate monooxygenase
MALPPVLRDRLRLPVIASPLFIVSGPDLVIAQCKAGIVGSFPSLNARPISQLDEWLARITEELADWDRAHPEAPSAPFAVNQIVHKTNNRLDEDVELCIKYKAPVIITSLGAREDLNQAIHSYGGVVMHDVITNRFARKAIEKGADGLIPVAAGAGGHAGVLSPFALIQEIREWFDGAIALSGSIANGAAILGAQAMGADLAYIGSAFIATQEANAAQGYKDMIVASSGDDIVYSNLFTGVHGNYLRPSIIAAGLDPDNLPVSDPSAMNFGSGGNTEAKAWRDIWGCGQGIAAIKDVPTAGQLVQRLADEYEAAKVALAAKTALTSGEHLVTAA